MKRLAKLKTDIENDDSGFTVNVYDDELDAPNNPVMWLVAYFEYDDSHETYFESEEDYEYYMEEQNKQSQDKAPTSIYVAEINFSDKLYFSMPKSRQDACGSTIIKKFIRYYNDNYGKNTDNWLPVYANFANYDLQEKFKSAVDAGIFPPSSKDMIEETDESNYKQNLTYNLNNRKLSNDIKNYPEKYFPNLNIVDGCAVNNSFSQIEKEIDDISEKYSITLDNTLYGVFRDGDIIVDLPIVKEVTFDFDQIYFTFERYNKEINFSSISNINELKKILLPYKDKLIPLFDGVNLISAAGRFSNENADLQEFFSSQDKTSKRLVKKN